MKTPLIDIDAATANRRRIERLRREEIGQGPTQNALRKRRSRAEVALRELLEAGKEEAAAS